MEKQSKEQRDWNKQLTIHLDRFTTVKQWPDLANWLVKLKQVLSEQKGSIVEKQPLFRKLASCLNNSLPIALHQLTIECYEIIVRFDMSCNTQCKIAQTISLLCVGLFPFFHSATIRTKTKILELINKHISKVKMELCPMATGLMVAIMPGLLEMNEQLHREIIATVDQFVQSLGEDIVIPSIWTAMLRSSQCRVPGLKYLTLKMMELGQVYEDPDDQEEDEFWDANKTAIQEKQKGEENIGRKVSEGPSQLESRINYLPYRETLVSNTLIACLRDSNSLVVKACLDFLYKFLSLRSDTLSEPERFVLIYHALELLIKRDISTTRKINLWLFGKPDEDNKYPLTEKNQAVLQIIIGCFQKHLIMNPQQGTVLKMLLNFYSEHQHLIEKTLPKLSKPLVEVIYRSNSKKDGPQIFKIALRIFDHVGAEKIVILQSLGRLLFEACSKDDMEESINLLNLIDFFIDKLLKEEEIKEKKELLVETTVLMADMFIAKLKSKPFIKSALQICERIFRKYEQVHYKKNQHMQPEGDFESAIGKFCKFYQELCQVIKTDDTYEQIFDIVTKMVIRLHRFRKGFTHANEWCESMASTIRVRNLQYYLTTIEGITKIIESSVTDPKYIPLRDTIVEDSRNRKGASYILMAFEKLWGLLSFNHLHQRTIQLILKLSKQFPNLLTEVVSSSFRGDHQQKQISIAKFSVFWKLTGRFKELLSTKEFNQINKIGLFIMLDFLEHENPLVRHTTKLWISDSLPQFSRIFDPLLEVLLQPSTLWYETPQGQLLYTRKFEYKRVVEIMKKIKILIQQAREKLIAFLLKPLSDNIKPYFEHFTDIAVRRNDNCSYLELIMTLLLKYLKGRFIIPGFQECHVDLISCELLESLLMVVDDPKLCFIMIRPYIKDIHHCLHFSILSSELVNQIQVLNLLKTILFSSSMRKSSDNDLKVFLKEFVSSPLFISSLILGLDNHSPYIKERYVQFLCLCIPLFLEYHRDPGTQICQLLNLYTSKIAAINSQRSEMGEYRDLIISRRNTEILILLAGIKDVFVYFLDLKMKPFEKEKTQNETDFGYFSLHSWKSFVALGLSNNRQRPKKVEDIAKLIIGELGRAIVTMVDCWVLSELQSLYLLSDMGIESFTSNRFQTFNKALHTVLSQYEQVDSVESYIINLIRVLYNNYPADTLNSLVIDWINAPTLEIRLKILEILIVMGLPVEQFYDTLCETVVGERIKKMDRKRKYNVLVVQRCFESDVILLCHAFSQYSYQSFNMTQLNHMTIIWQAFIKFAKLFVGNRNPLTLFMLVELIDMFIKKNNPKQLMWEDRIKKQVQTIASELTTLLNMANGKLKFSFIEGFKMNFQSLLPLSTSVYVSYLESKDKEIDAPVSYFMFGENSPDRLMEYLRIYSFIILRRIGYDLHQNLFSESDITLVKKVRQTFNLLFPVIEDKSPANLTFAEKSSQIVCYFMEQKTIYSKEFRNDILQIFNKDDFFICSRRGLQYWLRIMNLVIENNKDIDIFMEYLSKVSLASSIFTKESSETKKKIKSFERICFILYAGEKDRYNKRLVDLVEKIVDVIKDADAPQPVLILILFCIRVVILRTSSEDLTNLFVNLWPMVLFLLMNIFSKDFDGRPGTINLVWAALKLIEMISLTQMSEFNTQQWVFFYDFVGIRLDSKDTSDMGYVPLPYNYKPLIQKYLPQNVRPSFTSIIYTLQGRHKRNIIIKEDKIDDIELLKAKALALSQYMIINNSQKQSVNVKEVEQLIESDFLTLDQFIYKVK